MECGLPEVSGELAWVPCLDAGLIYSQQPLPPTAVHCQYRLEELAPAYLMEAAALGLALEEFDSDFDAFDSYFLSQELRNRYPVTNEDELGDFQEVDTCIRKGFHPGVTGNWR